MTPETFVEHFGDLASTPGAVQRLRELILQLAVQGKLVPQDPDDEPASLLLERIAAEKAKLVKEKKVKKPKALPPIDLDEVPFDLPEGWEWVRLEPISSYIQRGKGPTYAEISNVPVVSQKCVQWGGFDLSRARFIEPDTVAKYAEERFLLPGDLLWNSTGTGTIGRVNIFPGGFDDYPQIVADSHVTVVRVLEAAPEYVWLWLASSYIQDTIESDASGSTNQVELATGRVKEQSVPLPPLNEQRRIVERVGQLMALCDRLEQQETKGQENHEKLVKSALKALTTADGPDALQGPWRRVYDHFDPLITTSDAVAELRQTILQLAVMGKLVPQDPDDEPASVLLEKIAAEKARLVKEKKIRKPKALPPIDPGEVPFDLPSGWEWVRLGSVCSVKGGKRVPRGYQLLEEKTDHPYIRVSDMKDGTVNLNGIKYIDNDVFNSISKYTISSNDVYVTIAGTIGSAGLVPSELDGANLTENAAKLIFSHLSKNYLAMSLRSTLIRGQFLHKVNQMAQPKLALKRIESVLFPMPPRSEQHRIVERVDQLMALCDRLEAQLQQSQTDGARLMASAVRHLSAA